MDGWMEEPWREREREPEGEREMERERVREREGEKGEMVDGQRWEKDRWAPFLPPPSLSPPNFHSPLPPLNQVIINAPCRLKINLGREPFKCDTVAFDHRVTSS